MFISYSPRPFIAWLVLARRRRSRGNHCRICRLLLFRGQRALDEFRSLLVPRIAANCSTRFVVVVDPVIPVLVGMRLREHLGIGPGARYGQDLAVFEQL